MTDTQTPFSPLSHHTVSQRLFAFLGSMPLAITLLVVIAIASVIGTVLQQNQPYADYVRQFGPFWFAVFHKMGLYDVYSALWFLTIVAFLILSTSVCIYRKTPSKWRETRFRMQMRAEALRRLHPHAEWLHTNDVQTTIDHVTRTLRAFGYSWRVEVNSDHHVISAMKGRYHALGYVFTHAAVVIIGIGGLLDGNLWLKMKEWRGENLLETRDVAVRDVLPASRLAPGAVPSFRGNVLIPEGGTSNFVFLRLRDGFFVQELPFSVELQQFQVEYHTTGQPKSFTSQVRIHDKEYLGDTPLETTIRVNHPLVYRGYAIYQSDFSDGGSKLDFQAWPLARSTGDPVILHGEIGKILETSGKITEALGEKGGLSVELDNFRAINLLPRPNDQPGDRAFQHFGPSVSFKLRDATGQAREYFNYQLPAQIDGRAFFISGTRSASDAAFTYVHIPADAHNGPERFFRFNAKLRDMHGLQAALAQSTPTTTDQTPALQHDLTQVRLNLVTLFLQGGFAAVTERARALVPPDRLQKATELYGSLLRDALATVFLAVLREEGLQPEQGISDREETFFNDALAALSLLPTYGSPFYLQLTGFQQVQASGFQITYSRAAWIVYTGFALLIAGIFILFYTAQRRVWAVIAVETDGTQTIVAGTTQRAVESFAEEFEKLVTALQEPSKN